MPVTRHSTSDAPSQFPRVPREVIASVASALAVVIVVSAYVFVTGNAATALSVATRGRTAFEGSSEAPAKMTPAVVTPVAAGVPSSESQSSPPTAAAAPLRATPASSSLETAAATGNATVLGAGLTSATPAVTATPAAAVEFNPAPAPPPVVPAVVVTVVPVAAAPSTPIAAAPTAASALSVAVPPPTLTDRERGLLDAMNARRSAAGLATLEPLATLTSASRTRSNDMLANNYFAHTSPTGQTWYSLLSSAGVGYSAGGENLAKVSGSVTASVTQAIEALMASPTHRANILNPAFRKVGVGVAGQADQLTIFTSIFTDR